MKEKKNLPQCKVNFCFLLFTAKVTSLLYKVSTTYKILALLNKTFSNVEYIFRLRKDGGQKRGRGCLFYPERGEI